MLEVLFSAFAGLFSGATPLYLIAGVLLGLFVGTLPGLGGTAGMSLIVPFVFDMDPTAALAMMTGLLAVVVTGDTLTSVLMGIPGSASSQATVLDGFPLAKKGEAARALSAAFTASMAGGVIGAIILTAAILVARPIILAFGAGEMLMLVILGLSMVCILSGPSLIKGVIACGLGMLVGAIGAAPGTGEYRMLFGQFYLADGLPLVVVALGVFAIPEIVDLLRRARAISERTVIGHGWLQGAKDMIVNRWLVLRCAAIGSLVGALPGIGGSVVDWIVYGNVVQTSRNRENFGKGDIRGVIAPESANNATQGGSLIPTLIFGIPGSGATAIFLGGLLLLGLQPGPAMVETRLDVTYTIIWSLALANVIGAGICFLVSGQIARLTTIPYVYLAPFMLTAIFFAAFQSSRQFGDIIALMVIGVFATYMRRFGFPRPAFLIGFVLQINFERYIFQTIQFYSLEQLASRPLMWVLLTAVAASLYFGLQFRPTHSSEGALGIAGARTVWPQIGFVLFAIVISVAVIYDVRNLYFLGRLFPVAIALIVIGCSLIALVLIMRAHPADPIAFDSEADWRQREEGYQTGLVHYLVWIAALPAGVYLVGFLPSILAFFIVFLWWKSLAPWWKSGLLAGSAVAILVSLSSILVLRFPRGLLQQVTSLPWPLN